MTKTNTTSIPEAVAALSNQKRNEAIRAANAYGKIGDVLPEYADQIAANIEAFGKGETANLSIAAAGAIRSETEAAGLSTSCFAVSNGKAAASIDDNPRFPPITGRNDRIRYFEDRAEAQAMADQLNRTPGVRGGFKVVTL